MSAKHLSILVSSALAIVSLSQGASGVVQPIHQQTRRVDPRNGLSDPTGGNVITGRSSVATPTPLEPEAADPKKIEPSALVTLQEWGLSETEARKAWKLSGVLFGLQEKFKNHPDFGTTWNTVVETFSLNVRLVQKNPEIETEFSNLSKQIGEPIVFQYGGMSYQEMQNFKIDSLASLLNKESSFPQIPKTPERFLS